MKEMTHRYSDELLIFCNENHDKCTLCGKAFEDANTAHLGYLIDGDLAYLCDECSKHLKETVVRHYWQKREYEKPDINDCLWRYMDLAKFISLIDKKELYFSAAENLTDPFEGAKGVIYNKEKWNQFYYDFFQNAVVTAPGINIEELTTEKIEKDAQRLLLELQKGGERSRKFTFINCWYLNNFESEAMWKLYSKDITNAIAIRSTYTRLYNAINKNPSIAIGKVKYIDFDKRFSSINGAYWYKRKSFEYENEVRAIYSDFKQSKKPGIGIPVDIDVLIDKIFISPYATNWFSDVVNSIIKKYEVKKEILQSTMMVAPFY